MHPTERAGGDPQALTGFGPGRAVVSADHLAAVRPRIHHPGGHELGLLVSDDRSGIERAVVADEHGTLVAAGPYGRDRPQVVYADHEFARPACSLSLDL